MIKPPPTLPAHLQEQWIQATEEAYMEGVVATLARLHKQLGCNLSVDIDADFLAEGRKQFGHEPDTVVYLNAFK